MKIAVFGLGYVGLTAVCCLAGEGHEVVGFDVNETKVSSINSGLCPIVEPGLDELLKRGLAEKRIKACVEIDAQLDSCDMAFVCVGTPSLPDGSHNMSYIAEVTRQIASHIKKSAPTIDTPLTVVYRSTIRPGTIEGLIAPIFIAELGEDFERLIELVYDPEFLRESFAIKDYFEPPKVIIGTRDGKPSAKMAELCKDLKAPIFYVRYAEAEFTKFADNTWHAIKVGFANEIGRVCICLGIDPAKVHEIFVSDTKLNISPYYLRPGGPFGGSCLPKDVRALQHMSSEVGAYTPLIGSAMHSNDVHKHFLFELCTRGLNPKAKVLMLGIAFKDNSDDLRESPGVDMARKLLRDGYDLSIYDPHVEPSRLLGQNLGYAFSSLPTLRKLLIGREQAESRYFDLAIDTKGWAGKLNLHAARIENLNSLRIIHEIPKAYASAAD